MRLTPIVTALLCMQCGGSSVTGTAFVPATVTISAPSHSLRSIGDTVTLTATVKNQSGGVVVGAAVVWSSLAPSVATVSSGVVTAVTNGTAQIIAVSGTVTGQATVTVKQVVKTLTKASADTQAGIFREPLPQPVTVLACDSSGHPAAGVVIGFAIATGGGSLTSASVTTDSVGTAADTWTLGNTLGTQELVVTVNAPALVDTFFATGSDGLESLPQTVATVQAAVDLMTTGRIHVVTVCPPGNPSVNCPWSNPGPPNPLALTRDSLSISLVSPGVYSFGAQVVVVSDSTDIPVTYSGLSCTLSFNTAQGASPTVQVTGTATFTRQVSTDPIDRIDITNVAVSGLEPADMTISGGTLCQSANFWQSVGGSILGDAFTDAAPLVCGTPGGGPPLVELCPPPPTVSPARVTRRVAGIVRWQPEPSRQLRLPHRPARIRAAEHHRRLSGRFA